jgi:hypothetical protein
MVETKKRINETKVCENRLPKDMMQNSRENLERLGSICELCL